MEQSRCDLLLRKAAQQTSRRAMLGALVGGAFLLSAPGESEANDKAKRRKERHRKQRSRQAALSPFWVWVENPGPNPVPVTLSDLSHNVLNWACLGTRLSVTVPVGGRVPFASHNPSMYMSYGDQPRYYLEFWNLLFNPVKISAAFNGVGFDRANRWCPPLGTQVQGRRAIDEFKTIFITINGKVFTLIREQDTNYKVITVKLPANL